MPKKTLEERFWEKVDKNGPTMAHMTTPCWVWTGAANDQGYGHIGIEGKTVPASRVSLWLAKGGWPKHCALHHCDNPPCVNPAHLYDGDSGHNARDRERRNRGNHATGDRSGRRTHPECTARGEDHHNAKLTEVGVRRMRDLFACGTDANTLAALYDITVTHVWHVLHGKAWASAGGPIVPRFGKRRGAAHGNAALTTAQVLELRTTFTGKYGEQKAAAEKYGVDVQTIRRVVRGRSYVVAATT